MKRKILLPALALCLLLTGCGWLDGSYVSVKPHQEQRQNSQTDVIAASNYRELMDALEEIIAAGAEVAAINVADYPGDSVESGMMMAVRYAKDSYSIGAYAVESIAYELGTSSGLPAMSVRVTYRHNRSEIQQIRDVKDISEAESVVSDALEGYEASIVLRVEDYFVRDFTQFVQDYAEEHPETVMETPQVTESVYGSGQERVVELIFTYQTSRDALRRMQSQVKPVFDSASLYVSGDGADRQKYSQLYAFLMERFDYKVETSITPAYSLLRHGVGDSRAFATVYAAMCRGAGLECMTVTGTRAGEPWTWNIVLDDGQYYHVDLLHSNEIGKYKEFTDSEMSSYVWDYSAYPACNGKAIADAEETAEPSESTETGAATEPEEKS